MSGLLDQNKETSETGDKGEKGETVLTAFGKEKGQAVLAKEITSNEVSGGNLRPPPGSTTDTKTAEESATTQAEERMKGHLKDVGISQKD